MSRQYYFNQPGGQSHYNYGGSGALSTLKDTNMRIEKFEYALKMGHLNIVNNNIGDPLTSRNARRIAKKGMNNGRHRNDIELVKVAPSNMGQGNKEFPSHITSNNTSNITTRN